MVAAGAVERNVRSRRLLCWDFCTRVLRGVFIRDEFCARIAKHGI